MFLIVVLGAAHAVDIDVSDAAGLVTALTDGEDGDVILLAPGAYAIPSVDLHDALTLRATVPGAVQILPSVATSGPTTLFSVFSDVRFEDVEIDVGTTHRAVFVGGGASVVLQGTTIRNGSHASGGQIFADFGASLVATGSRFEGGRAQANAGSMFLNGAVADLTDCTFVDNQVTNSQTAYPEGGAVRLGAGANATFTRVTFEANENPTHLGGAVAVLESTVAFDDCTFVGNVGGSGGAVGSWRDSTIDVRTSTFTGNTAYDGGGLSCFTDLTTGCTITIADSVFTGGSADTAPYLSSGGSGEHDVTLRRSTFAGGTSTGGSGALHIGGHATVEGCVFSANTGSDEGGALVVEGDLVSSDNVFADNAATLRAGAVLARGVVTTSRRDRYCRNSSGAGAAMVAEGSLTLENALAVGNQDPGPGVFRLEQSGMVAFSTIADSSGGVQCLGSCTVSSSILSHLPGGGVSGPVATVVSTLRHDAQLGPGVLETLPIPFTAEPYPNGTDCDDGLFHALGWPYAGAAIGLDVDGSIADPGWGGGLGADPALWGDADQDGVQAVFDCDDGDPQVYPGAVDVPGNGVDEDCDGSDGGGSDADTDADSDSDTDADADTDSDADADSDADTDADSDADTDADTDSDTDTGTGGCDPSDPLTDCDADGQSPRGGDCDDADPTVYLGAEELPDAVDHDCDGDPMPHADVRGACGGCAATPAVRSELGFPWGWVPRRVRVAR